MNARQKKNTKIAEQTDPISVSQELIQHKILLIRGQKVMLDRELAQLYAVQTKVLNQAVRRNQDRFPPDFMFQLSKTELENWRSQIVTSNQEKMGLRRKPYASTEQGIAMLSSVLHSSRAIQVNIQIMRAFIKLRELMVSHKDLAQKIHELERKHNQHDKDILVIFEALKCLMHSPEKPKNPIGFQVHLRKEKTE